MGFPARSSIPPPLPVRASIAALLLNRIVVAAAVERPFANIESFGNGSAGSRYRAQVTRCGRSAFHALQDGDGNSQGAGCDGSGLSECAVFWLAIEDNDWLGRHDLFAVFFAHELHTPELSLEGDPYWPHGRFEARPSSACGFGSGDWSFWAQDRFWMPLERVITPDSTFWQAFAA